MSDYTTCLQDLVIANRILAHENVVDAYGHVSVRHPDNPQRFLLSRSRSPELVTLDDIMEFTLERTPSTSRTGPFTPKGSSTARSMSRGRMCRRWSTTTPWR